MDVRGPFSHAGCELREVATWHTSCAQAASPRDFSGQCTALKPNLLAAVAVVGPMTTAGTEEGD